MRQLKRFLADRWMRRTGDAALSGRIEPTQGMLARAGDKDLTDGEAGPAEPVILDV